MSNTVITNYTDLNGPSSKADSSVVVIVNKDGSLSVDQNLLGTLMGTDGSQGAGISVVRVGHEGRPDDATDTESDEDKVPHVTLSVDSYYDEPNSIIKYDSGAEMLQSLRIETRENSLVGFQNDHCYTPLTSPSQGVPQRSDSFSGYEDSVIEITHTPPPKPVPQSKKITILEQQIIPKGKKLVLNSADSGVLLKGNDVLNKPLPSLSKSKQLSDLEKSDSSESSSISSGDSIPDRDSDSDYKDTKDRSLRSVRKSKVKPRILKSATPKVAKLDPKIVSRVKSNKNVLKKDIKEKLQQRSLERKQSDSDIFKETILPIQPSTPITPAPEIGKVVPKPIPKPVKKEKKTPAHMTALLSDMTSLFSTPDVIRRVSTDGKTPIKPDKEPKTKGISLLKTQEPIEPKLLETQKTLDPSKAKVIQTQKTIVKPKVNPTEKVAKGFDLIPQLDDASLAQILQDTTGVSSNLVKPQANIITANAMNSPGLAGPLSPTLDLLGGLQPEEEGLTEDLLMHVAQLVESSENLQEVIDKQVLGKVDTGPPKPSFQHAQNAPYAQTPTRAPTKSLLPRKDPIEIVRRDGRVITLPPIEAPATRSSKRKSQIETPPQPIPADILATPTTSIVQPMETSLDLQAQHKQYINKAKLPKKQESLPQTPIVDKLSAESQESWNSEDDPYRLWCICKQPHNNRFMICCDGCEDWFHGKCVNITKAMGQQMEERGIEWRCPNCIKKSKTPNKQQQMKAPPHKKSDLDELSLPTPTPVLIPKDSNKTGCIVCKRPARASSIYCSDACILKHAQDSLGSQTAPTKLESESGKPLDKQKSDSRVIVYERKSGRLLAGPNAPTAENLKTWLQKNPTFEVVRPGTLHTIKPNLIKKKSVVEANRIQTTLNFERIPRKSNEQPASGRTPQPEGRARLLSPREQLKSPPARVPLAGRTIPVAPAPAASPTPSAAPAHQDTPRPGPSSARPMKPANRLAGRSQSSNEKAPSVSPSTSRRKEAPDTKKRMDSTEPIRDNVRKSLQEQMTIRMVENKGPKFTKQEIHQFAVDTENELHELFGRDVGMKYKAKYRSLMFNIKDRKNLTLWQKICDRKITPSQLVRLSPEELASQELAQWREEEAKHQLELIKKSELDLLAASKTYVLKTHKGEEVMETKEPVQAELDPEVPVEDLVTALNDSTVGEEVTNEANQDKLDTSKSDSKHNSSKKRDRDNGSASRSKKSNRESKRDSESRKSRSSRRRSDGKERDERSIRRSEKKAGRARSLSKDRPKDKSDSKEMPDSSERSRRRSRSRSRAKSKRRSKSREHSRSTSQGRERSRSRSRERKRSPARTRKPAPPRERKPSPIRDRKLSPPREAKRRRSSRNKHSSSTDEKQRSRSQESVTNKSKQDSTDSDSIERPKSALLKEVHPEYDPHEPMITSAFSEEDLRKSGESFDETTTYKPDIIEDYGDNAAYDPAKEFSIDTGVILPSSKPKTDKVSEAESDQEPSSTVENSAVMVWNGCINMVDVARFYVAAHEVSGSAADLEEDLTAELDIVGRINPDTVWEYIGKMKRASNKDIIVLKLQAANDEEKMQYIALYSYLSSRNRLGVVKVSNTATVKDFYIVPLPANTPLPSVLLPLDRPGLGEIKTHLLLAIVIRQRKKRPAPAHIPKDIVPAKMARTSRKRSYTPPVPVPAPSTATPPASRLPLPAAAAAYSSPALSTSVKDKIAASLAAANDDDEAYSPGSSSSGGSVPPPAGVPTSTLRTKVEELNRQIEEQKQQILKMAQADSSVPEEEEAYSPSRPMTPPEVAQSGAGAAAAVGDAPSLADIALPSNLQEILATIKQRSETNAGDVDMRNLPLPP